MRKLLLGVAIGLGSLTATSAMAAVPAFSAQKTAQVKVPDLSFKQIMRELYSSQMTRAFINDEAIESLPHVGLGAEKGGEQTVAVMHPIIRYPSSTGQTRYLVIIEKLKVYASNGSLVSCHACSAKADLYSFKRLSNGQYQLVSKSVPNLKLSSSWGRIQFDAEEIRNGIQPLGKNLVGSIFSNGYTSTGTSETWWDVLHLPENDYINVYKLGDAGGDNSGNYEETSPLYYSYESTYDVIRKNSTYFPIKLTYTGDKPTADYERIEPVNYSVIKEFDPVRKQYK